MLRNYLIVALRTIMRQKVYGAVNVVGLAVAMACGLMVLLYTRHELRYDTYHAHADRIYRVVQDYTDRHGDRQSSALTSGTLASALEDGVPGVEEATRLYTYSWKEQARVRSDDQTYYEDRVFLADPNVFRIFSFDFLEGDAASALAAPGTVVISRSTAKKYFGDAPAVGRSLHVALYDEAVFEVTGVVADPPETTHFKADVLLPMASAGALLWPDFDQRIAAPDFYTYVRLDAANREASLAAALGRMTTARDREAGVTYRLQRLTDIHLRSHLQNEIAPNGSLASLYLFGLLAVLLFLVACINYANLAVARSMTRLREIGVRKVMGASRPRLVMQFLLESTLLALVALPLSWALVEGMLPAFEAVTGTHLPFGWTTDGATLLALATAMLVLTGITAGLYPALVAARHEATALLKVARPRASTFMQRSLVVFQFAVSIGFVVGAAAIQMQLRYVRGREMGFDRAAVVVLPIHDDAVRERYPVLRDALGEVPGVAHVGATTFLPGSDRRSYSDTFGGDVPPDRQTLVRWDAVDAGFVETFGLKMAAGHDLADTSPDDAGGFLINETAARAFGWDRPLGKRLGMDRDAVVPLQGTVVGVLQDFHFASLHQPIEPLVLRVDPEQYEYVVVKIGAGDVRTVLQLIETAWHKLNPDQPFDYFFLDAFLDQAYRQEIRLGQVMRFAGLLVVVIAALGLFGLAALTTTHRTREIGIRKVMGASATRIVLLLNRDVTLLVGVAFVLAVPAAAVLLHRWLQSFAFRMTLSPWLFVTAGLATLALAWLAVSYQAVSAARADPVDTLRAE